MLLNPVHNLAGYVVSCIYFLCRIVSQMYCIVYVVVVVIVVNIFNFSFSFIFICLFICFSFFFRISLHHYSILVQLIHIMHHLQLYQQCQWQIPNRLAQLHHPMRHIRSIHIQPLPNRFSRGECRECVLFILFSCFLFFSLSFYFKFSVSPICFQIFHKKKFFFVHVVSNGMNYFLFF